MTTPKNFPNITFQDDTEMKDLLTQLEEAKIELRDTSEDVDRINKDVRRCRDELDQRMMIMMMMLQKDEGLFNSFVELNAIMQEKASLSRQLEELPLSGIVDSKQALLNSLQKEKSSLLEQEHNLKLKHEQLSKELAEASANIGEGAQVKNSVKPNSSGQNKSTGKAVRKRGARK